MQCEYYQELDLFLYLHVSCVACYYIARVIRDVYYLSRIGLVVHAAAHRILSQSTFQSSTDSGTCRIINCCQVFAGIVYCTPFNIPEADKLFLIRVWCVPIIITITIANIFTVVLHSNYMSKSYTMQIYTMHWHAVENLKILVAQ